MGACKAIMPDIVKELCDIVGINETDTEYYYDDKKLLDVTGR